MKKRTLILVYYWVTTLAWAGFIYFLSEQPDLRITKSHWDAVLRQLSHAFVFAILTILTYRSLLWTVRTKVRELELRKDYDASIMIEGLLLIISALATVLYACFDEYHQTLVPTRVGDIVDVLTDSAGVVLASLIMLKAGIITELEHRFARKGWLIITGQKYYGE